MPILYLILSHMLGDFAFQTNKVFAYKVKSPFGMLFHVLIIYITSLALLSPYIYNPSVFKALTVSALIHYISDVGKFKYQKFFKAPITSFFIDQIIHIFFILFVFFTVRNVPPIFPFKFLPWKMYKNIWIAAYFTMLSIISYPLDTAIWVYNPKPPYKRNYKRIGIISGAATIAYIIVWIGFSL